MEFDYRFTITEEEMYEYYQYIFALNPKNKRRAIWIKLSIPVLALLTVFLFRLYKYTWVVIVMCFLIVVWWVVLSGKLYSGFVNGQVQKWFTKNVNSTSFSEVHVQFEDNIIVDDKKIDYANLNTITPLKHILIFSYGENEMFIIPNRAVGEEADMEKLSKFIKQQMH